MKRLLTLSLLAAATGASASTAQAAPVAASTTPTSVQATTKARPYIAGGAVGSVAGVVAISTSDEYCTGAVIAPRVVLTAAHCLQGVSNTSSIRVRLEGLGQNLGVSHGYIAPGFNAALHQNDAAVLILKSPAKVAALQVVRTEPLPGTAATITGYGQRTYTSAIARNAYSADTIIQSFASCQVTGLASAVPCPVRTSALELSVV